LFKDTKKNEVTQVVSIYDKKTNKVEVIEKVQVPSTTTVSTIQKEVFSSAELITAEESYPSITTSLEYVREQFP
jgi:hypothetical protein